MFRYIALLCKALSGWILAILMGVLTWLFPGTMDRQFHKTLEKMGLDERMMNSFRRQFYDWRLYKFILQLAYDATIGCQAWEGQAAPNPTLIDLDGTSRYQLLDFAKKNWPLVVNFGSCS